jgi:hypothetical protein
MNPIEEAERIVAEYSIVDEVYYEESNVAPLEGLSNLIQHAKEQEKRIEELGATINLYEPAIGAKWIEIANHGAEQMCRSILKGIKEGRANTGSVLANEIIELALIKARKDDD